jgi:CHAT domain-containing protein
MTLYPVNDGQARDFMIAFYKRWLEQRRRDPTAALRETKLAYLRGPDSVLRDPKVWAPYVLVGR